MEYASLAPCGVICDLCLAAQRTKNPCAGCNSTGNKPSHCVNCGIKTCSRRPGDYTLACLDCADFPCRRLKDLDKRYISRYGVSPLDQLRNARTQGVEAFIHRQAQVWQCEGCGALLCVHSSVCLHCGHENSYFPQIEEGKG